MKIVLDTNIWISGLILPKSKAGKVILAWQEAKFQIVTSPAILSETEEVLHYPKIKRRLQWEEDKISQYLTLLRFFSDYTTAPATKSSVRDPKDQIILDAFVASKADYLVTGDHDLLALQGEYSILPLADFFDLL